MMGKTVHKLIAITLILFLLSNTFFPILAQEVTPTDTPTPTVSDTQVITIEDSAAPINTPIPTNEPGTAIETLEHTSTDATTERVLINPNTGITIFNAGDNLTATSSSTENTAVTIANNNDTDIHKDVTDTNDTGNNIANDNISLGGTSTEIKTGDASSFQNLVTMVNTNILATSADALLVNIFDPSYQPIDLSQTSSCNAQTMLNTPDILNVVNTGNNVKVIDADALNTSTSVDNNNVAHITNNVDLTTNTGNNQAIGNIGSATTVDTGNATIGLNMTTVANTNLVGNCWFYGVVNLFGSQNGDIILPYEYDILNGNSQGFVFNRSQTDVVNTGNDTTVSTNATTNLNTKIANANGALVNTTVNSNANSGNNSIEDAINFDSGQTITTGNVTNIVNILDMLNTNIVGNKFFALRINKFGSWTGTIRGWMGNILEFPDYVLLYNGQFPISAPTPTPDPSQTDIVNTGDSTTVSTDNTVNNSINVTNNNLAQIDNNINLLADTGNNSAGKFNAHITTGNASILANIFNMANTNIVGDNWFYAVVNIFNNFVGDIVFPRPGLAVTTSTNQNQVQSGDTVTFTNHLGNIGTHGADNVVVTDTLPNDATFVSASDGGIFGGSSVKWNLDKLAQKANHDFFITLRFGSNANNNQLLQNNCSVSTATPEPNTSNNSGSFGVLFYVPGPQQPQTSNSNSSGGGNGGSSSSSSSGGTGGNSNNSGTNQQPDSWSDQNYIYQWVTYTTRVYNRKTKNWEKKTFKKLVKKLIKKPVFNKLVVFKKGKKIVKLVPPLKLKRPPLKLQTFTNFYSSIFSRIVKKNS